MDDVFEDKYIIPISALQHYAYCPRQFALIHLEQQWNENQMTAEGRVLHSRVDRPEHECRDGVRTEFAVDIRSDKLRLIGKADCVEFHKEQVYPIEYKRGRPKPDFCDWIQLCAQAFCLEEMMDVEVSEGVIFYGQPRRHQAVVFDSDLRAATIQTIDKTRKVFESGKTPAAQYNSGKCRSCSLLDICMPKKSRPVEVYIQESLKRLKD